MFIVTIWYKCHEVQKKLAELYMTSILAGGFSAILAYALSLLEGKGGLGGWSDWKIWVYGALMYMCAAVPAYVAGFFVTLILSGMGWNLQMSLLLSASPYISAAVSILIFAWLSDRYHMRALFLAIQTLMTIIGLVLTAHINLPGWRYTGGSDDLHPFLFHLFEQEYFSLPQALRDVSLGF